MVRRALRICAPTIDSLEEWTRLQPVQFEFEDEPQLREVRLATWGRSKS